MPIIAKKNYDSKDVLFRVLESNENDEVRDFVRFLRNDKNERLVRNFKEVFIKKMDFPLITQIKYFWYLKSDF